MQTDLASARAVSTEKGKAYAEESKVRQRSARAATRRDRPPPSHRLLARARRDPSDAVAVSRALR